MTLKDDLNSKAPGDWLGLARTGQNHQILGITRLNEEHDNGQRTGRSYTALFLSADYVLITEMPVAEGGQLMAFVGQRRDCSGFSQYLVGDPKGGRPGPAPQFGKTGQRGNVTCEFDGRMWLLTDLGAEAYVSEGETPLQGQGKSRHVTANSQDGTGESLVHLDLIEAKGAGQDSAWVGAFGNLYDMVELAN